MKPTVRYTLQDIFEKTDDDEITFKDKTKYVDNLEDGGIFEFEEPVQYRYELRWYCHICDKVLSHSFAMPNDVIPEISLRDFFGLEFAKDIYNHLREHGRIREHVYQK